MILLVVGMFLATLIVMKEVLRDEVRKELEADKLWQIGEYTRLARRYGSSSHHWNIWARVEKHYRRAKRKAPEHQCTYRGNLEAIRQGMRHEYTQLRKNNSTEA